MRDRRCRRSPVLNCLLCAAAAGVVGCAGGGPMSGERILADLERDGVGLEREDRAAGVESAPDAARLPTEGPIELADLLGAAAARHPRIGAAESEVGMASGALWQASLYPNPRLDVEVEDVSTSDGFSSGKTTVGITQPLILGGRRAAAIDEAQAERSARLAGVEAARREVFGEIAVEHARLVGILERTRLLQELRGLTLRTLRSSEERFEARAAPESDVIRPRVEMHRIDAALARLDQERRTSVRRLELALGGEPIDGSRIGGVLGAAPAALDIAALEARVRTSHPQLIAADREIEAAEARHRREEAERTGDLDVRVAAGYRAENDDGVVEFGAGMPLPIWDAQQGDILSARFEVMRARQRRAALENELLAQLAEAAGQHEAARAQAETLREGLLPDAERVFEQTVEGHAAGRASFLDLLDAQRTYMEARLSLLEFAVDASVARARTMQIAGPEPPGAVGGDDVVDMSGNRNPSIERPRGAEATP